jgi:hypothetical protein
MAEQEIKVIHSYPPNYQIISENFPVTENQVYAYYPNIYIPSDKDPEPSLLLHENVHCESQKKIGVDVWWFRYITDREFRLEEELIAFAAQFAFIKTVYQGQQVKDMLHEFAVNLSSPLYGNLVSKSEADTLIRLRAKEYHS